MLEILEEGDYYRILFPRTYNYMFQSFKKSMGTKFDILISNYNTGFFTRGEIKFYKFLLIEFYIAFVNKYNDRKIRNKQLANVVIKLLENNTPIKAVLDGKLDNTKLSRKLNFKNIENRMNFSILKHQEKFFKEYLYRKELFNLRGIYLEGGVGVGKTFMGLAMSEALGSQRVLIICPLPTKQRVWGLSLEETLYKDKQDVYYVGDTKDNYKNEKFIVVHYEAMNKLDIILKTIKKYNVTLIVDEAHNFNEMKSNRTQKLIELSKELMPSDIILLSGTPIKALARELQIVVELLSTDFKRAVRERFRKLYKNPNDVIYEAAPVRYGIYRVLIKKESMDLLEYFEDNIPVKVKDEDKFLIEIIRDNMRIYIESRINEMLKNRDFTDNQFKDLLDKYIPEVLEIKIINQDDVNYYLLSLKKIRIAYDDRNITEEIIELLPKVNSFENTLASIMSSEDRKLFKEVKSIYKYPMLKALGEALGRIVTKRRIDASLAISEVYDFQRVLERTDKKVIIFTNYVKVAEYVYERINKESDNIVGVFGNNTKDLSKSVNKFLKDDNIKFLVATYKSLSTGVPLIVANRIIAIDSVFRDYLWQQAKGRAWRLGQDTEVIAYKLFLDTGDEPNITTRTISILEWSRQMSAYLTGTEVILDDTGIDENVKEEKETVEFEKKALKNIFDW